MGKSKIGGKMENFGQMGTMPITTPACRCTYFTQDFRFIGVTITFDCPLHGQVTIDRRYSYVPPVSNIPYMPSYPLVPSYPSYPYTSPTWFNTAGGAQMGQIGQVNMADQSE